eukprot:scaffold84717_cov59-Phaeocystis_antarctica.AAC.1
MTSRWRPPYAHCGAAPRRAARWSIHCATHLRVPSTHRMSRPAPRQLSATRTAHRHKVGILYNDSARESRVVSRIRVRPDFTSLADLTPRPGPGHGPSGEAPLYSLATLVRPRAE